MPERRIFVSCGQRTEPERALGQRLKAMIDAQPGMTAFFANEVHSSAGLNAEVFEAIRACDGFLAVLHHRGEVQFPGDAPSHRSSVWVQQEIAIFAYRMFLEGAARPMRVYEQRGMIRPLEGLMGAAVMNPIMFDVDEEVIAGVDEWLRGREFEEDPILTTREAIFRRRSQDLAKDELLLLELVAAYSVQPSDRVDYASIRGDFFPAAGGILGDEALTRRLQVARESLERRELIGWRPNPGGGRNEVWIQRQWWQLVLDDLRSRGRRV